MAVSDDAIPVSFRSDWDFSAGVIVVVGVVGAGHFILFWMKIDFW
jgi:hypothetical protein